jgi:hypothetical protein
MSISRNRSAGLDATRHITVISQGGNRQAGGAGDGEAAESRGVEKRRGSLQPVAKLLEVHAKA